jgi:ABC-type spermidine/putrescine transport system permease subunit II
VVAVVLLAAATRMPPSLMRASLELSLGSPPLVTASLVTLPVLEVSPAVTAAAIGTA